MNHFSKAILLPLLAVAISCTSETLNYNIGAPTVSECKAEVTNTTKYVTLSAGITKPSQVSTAGFYVSEDASMSSAEKIVASTVSERISAEYLPLGYGKTYYYKAFISNGLDERCSEKESFRTEKFSYYVNLESTIESMTETTATVSASMTIAKGITPTSKGFCYGEKENVTIEDNVKEVTSSAFTAEIPCGKQTYIRAFVRDGDNVTYSDPVVAVQVESITLDRETVNMNAGETLTLKATAVPAIASINTKWKSSNEKVATVNNGKVTAVGNGTATITATCNEKSTTCVVMVKQIINGHEYVDLGLSVKWATCNVGASKPEENGGYYQWAGTKDVTSTSIYLYWDNCPYHTGSSYETGWTKYNTKSSYGKVDNKTVLDPSDDAAYVNWGGSWRIPTDAEWKELRNNCTWTWTTQNGVKGHKVTSKKTGYTSNFIFLPAAGPRSGGSLYSAGSAGYYWSSSLRTDDPYDACNVRFDSDDVSRSYCDRYYGLSVRPVSE